MFFVLRVDGFRVLTLKDEQMNLTGFMKVRIDRGSVHPGDDLEAHVIELSVTAATTIGELLYMVKQASYLPGISGGEATWLVELVDGKAGRIGVMAQQWPEPRLTIPLETPINELLFFNRSSFYFRYWGQSNPEAVFESLVYNRELPDRYKGRLEADPARSGAAGAGVGRAQAPGGPVVVESAGAPEKKEGRFTWLNIAVFVWGLAGLICIVPLMCMFPFMFDKPGSAADPLAWLMVLLQFSFPVVSVLSSLGVWVLKKRNRRLAFVVSLLPFFSLIIILGSMMLQTFFNQNKSGFQNQGQTRQTSPCEAPIQDGGDGLVTSGCGRLDFGWSGGGVTKTTAEAQNWQFSASSGVRTGISVQNDGKTCPQIIILDSRGRLVEGFVNENSRRTCLAGMIETYNYFFTPPATDIYIIRLVSPNTAGAYWLKLQ